MYLLAFHYCYKIPEKIIKKEIFCLMVSAFQSLVNCLLCFRDQEEINQDTHQGPASSTRPTSLLSPWAHYLTEVRGNKIQNRSKCSGACEHPKPHLWIPLSVNHPLTVSLWRKFTDSSQDGKTNHRRLKNFISPVKNMGRGHCQSRLLPGTQDRSEWPHQTDQEGLLGSGKARGTWEFEHESPDFLVSHLIIESPDFLVSHLIID